MTEATNIPLIQLPEITILSEKPSPTDTSFQMHIKNALISIYFIGFSFFAIRFLIQLFAIRNLIVNNRYNIKYWQGCNLIHTNGKLPTFSFFNYLFWDNTVTLSEDEQNQILKHELVHIKQYHSIDVIYFQLISIVFWFNPVIFWYKHAATDVHEFIADREASGKNDIGQYSKLLVQQIFKSMDLSLGSYFNKSQTMRRLEMLKSRNKRYNLLKVVLTLPALLIMTLIMGFNIHKNPAYHTYSSYNLRFPPPQKSTFRNLLDQNPDNNIFKSFNNPIDDQQLNQQLAEDDVSTEDNKAMTSEFDINLEIQTNDNQVAYATDSVMLENESIDTEEIKEVFTVVEVPPSPVDGMEALYTSIKETLKYPKQARKLGIEGRVFVQFIVTKEGNVEQVEILKGIGAGCDQEAARVVKTAHQWNPGLQRGKAVNVRMVLPITFKLQ